MRIVFITPIFWPEMGAPTSRFAPIVREFVAAGHDVFVATGMPNYPTGVVFPGYEGKFSSSEQWEGATILRTNYYIVPRNISKVKQFLSYLSNIPAWFLSGMRAGKVDVVFLSSPPLFVVPAGLMLARAKKAKIVCDLRDVWPDEIIAVGAAKEGSKAVKLLRKWERKIYQKADLISCTTRAIEDIVVERGGTREKILSVPNGADVELFAPRPYKPEDVEKFGLGDRKVVMYSGLMGLKFGLDQLLDAAIALQDRKDVVFFFLGDGVAKKPLMDRAESLGLTNVVFGDGAKLEDVPKMLARADITINCLQPDPYLEKIISVKMFEYMACEKPVVAALRGEGARVIDESGAGIVVEPGNGEQIAAAVRELLDDPERRAEMGRKGREYVIQHYSRTATARKLERALSALVSK
ncbi:MAG: glycosyltransferase family 4 protein [Fimbriimonas sp.]